MTLEFISFNINLRYMKSGNRKSIKKSVQGGKAMAQKTSVEVRKKSCSPHGEMRAVIFASSYLKKKKKRTK